MANLSTFDHIWATITEVDTTALRAQTQTPLRLALLGSDGRAIHWLYDMLRTDPITQVQSTQPGTIFVYQLPADKKVLDSTSTFDLALIVVGVEQTDMAAEQQIVRDLIYRNPQLPVVIVKLTTAEEPVAPVEPGQTLQAMVQICVDCAPSEAHADDLARRLLYLFPEQHVWLAHHLPGLRPAVCKSLIKETSIANAGYAASTGVAEMVPMLFLPLNVADLIILSKNQALLSYKLALCLGKDIPVQDMAVELAGVLGTGFLWRELARIMVGWIPGIGIVPKIGVAYAGTYVIGEAVYLWYGYGKRMSPEQIRELFSATLVEGSQRARTMLPERRPTFRLPAVSRPSLPRPTIRRSSRRCPNCQAKVGRKAQFCPTCGYELSQTPLLETDTETTPPSDTPLPSQ